MGEGGCPSCVSRRHESLGIGRDGRSGCDRTGKAGSNRSTGIAHRQRYIAGGIGRVLERVKGVIRSIRGPGRAIHRGVAGADGEREC